LPRVDTKELLSNSLDSIWLEYGKLNGLVGKQRALISEINKELGLWLPVSKSKPRNVLE
jgi:hypothetical protein